MPRASDPYDRQPYQQPVTYQPPQQPKPITWQSMFPGGMNNPITYNNPWAAQTNFPKPQVQVNPALQGVVNATQSMNLPGPRAVQPAPWQQVGSLYNPQTGRYGPQYVNNPLDQVKPRSIQDFRNADAQSWAGFDKYFAPAQPAAGSGSGYGYSQTPNFGGGGGYNAQLPGWYMDLLAWRI